MHQPSPRHVALSRWLNARRGGDPDTMLCAALHVEGSRWRRAVLDAGWAAWCVVRLRRVEWRHCERTAEYEALRRAVPARPDEVARFWEGR